MSWQHSQLASHPHPVGQPASRLLPGLASPPSLPHPREDQAGGWESPCLFCLPPSFPPSPSLPPSLLRPPLRQGPCKSRRGGTDRPDGVQLSALGSPPMPYPGWESPASWDLHLCELGWFPSLEGPSGRLIVPLFCIRTPLGCSEPPSSTRI